MQFRLAAAGFKNPAQTSSSSKNAGPFCELKKLKLFDLTGKDLQCFSHEDVCFAPEAKLKSSQSELLPVSKLKSSQPELPPEAKHRHSQSELPPEAKHRHSQSEPPPEAKRKNTEVFLILSYQ